MNEQFEKQDCKQTGSIEGGNKPHLALVVPPSNGAIPGSPFDAGTPAVAATTRPVLSNESNGIPLSLSDIREYLESMTGGWPKSAAGALCYARKDQKTGRDKPEYLKDAPALFAWIDDYAHVKWCKKSGCYSKEEFLRHLEAKSHRYAWATDLPHSPPLPEVLYTNKPPVPANTGRLDEFVALFDLHEKVDCTLVKAFVMTPFWGGPGGKRPLFVFSAPADGTDVDAGRGAGKSTVAQAVAKVAGGALSLRRSSEEDRVLSDLISPAGLATRVVLLDNIKSLKLSSEFIESLITADEVDGHRLYAGHAKRPNVLTYVLTANEPMLSKDLATRSIPIFIKQAKKSPEWDAKLHDKLNDPIFLEELYADILWHFQQPTKGESANESGAGSAYDRWAFWWREVASRVCHDDDEFRALLIAVKERRGVLDGDLSEAQAIEEALVNAMTCKAIKDPEDVFVFFPTQLLPHIVPEVLGRREAAISLGRRLRAMQLPKLLYAKGGPLDKRNGFWWIGSKAQMNPMQANAYAFCESSSPYGEPMCKLTGKRPSIGKLLPTTTTSSDSAE